MPRRWLRKLLPLVLLVIAILAGKAFWPIGDAHVYGGLPRAIDWLTQITTHNLGNPGFAVGYSELRASPLWVAYIARDPSSGPPLARPDDFSVDGRTLRRIDSDDYRNSGYNRGHLAPNYLISRVYGEAAQDATFRMTNIVPQKPRLNQLLWQRLEELEADRLAPKYGQLWVLTGPIFGDQPRYLRGGVPIPEAFYRIWVREAADGTPHAIAFIVPQRVCGFEALQDFVVPVARVERLIGYDLLHALEDTLERRISAGVSLEDWPLVANAPREARYGDRWKGQPCPYQ